MRDGRKLIWKEVGIRADIIAKSIEECKRATNIEDVIKLYGVPRGGVYAAQAVSKALENRLLKSILVNDPKDCHFFIDDLIDSGATKKRILKKHGSKFFYTLIKKEKNDPWIKFPWEVDEDGDVTIEDNIIRILEYIGEDPNREGLLETPKRVIKSFDTLFGGYRKDPKKVLKMFEETKCDEMVLLKDIEFYSTCEHHMLPFFGVAHIAYIPKGKILGVSKLVRILEIYARRLQVQERLCHQVTDFLQEALQPQGVACVLEAQHFCMTARGVQKQHSKMVTSTLTGVFNTSTRARNEFMTMIKG